MREFVATAPDRIAETDAPFGVRDLLGAARRRAWLIGASCAVAAALALVYLADKEPEYRADARIIVEPNVTSVAEDILSTPAQVPKAELVDSQVEILKASDTALQVIQRLDLANDPEFTADGPSPASLAIGRLRAFLGQSPAEPPADPADEGAREARALEALGQRLDVSRVGETLVIEVGFSSRDAEKAASIAQAFIDVFMAEQDEARLGEARRNSAWLKERANELLDQYLAADRRLQDARGRAVGSAQLGRSRAFLDALEQEVETFKGLHQTFVERYTRSLDWGSYPLMQTRVISAARPPLDPSSPNKPLTLALALVLGGLLGTGAAIILECMDRSLRTGAQVRRALRLPYLGMLPKIRGGKGVPDLGTSRFSAYTETLRSIRVAVDAAHPHEGSRVIGIVSALPGEGTSAVAETLARLLHEEGARTLLVDATRRGALAGALPDPTATGLARVAGSVTALRGMIDEARGGADYVVVDLPPVGLISDAASVALAFDSFVLVVRWGSTPVSVVDAALARNPQIARRCAGVVLNRAVPSRVRLYDNGESADSYLARHASFVRG